MRKNLIALAVLAASGVASAQSTVTLYGIADVWVGSAKSADLRQTLIGSGGVDESRFGFKGSEDLGGGLKAHFVLEQGFQIDTGAAGKSINNFKLDSTTPSGFAESTATFSRQAHVGLSGGFGEARIGKTLTPFDDINGLTRPAFNSVLSPDSGVWLGTLYQVNPDNTLYYATPDFSGFSGAASYSLGENKTAAASAGRVVSAHLKYEGGPVYAGLAYQAEKFDGSAATAKFTRLNGSYDLGVVRLLAGYSHVASQFVHGSKTKEFEIGADFPVSSALTISGGYAHSRTSDIVGINDTQRKGYSLAAAYSLSKRTYLYGGVQASKGTQEGSPDVKADLYAVGIHHTF